MVSFQIEETLEIRSPDGAVKEFDVVFHADQRDQDALARNRTALELTSSNRGILVIYTGGTIGSVPLDRLDPTSPQVAAPWAELAAAIPALTQTSPQSMNFRIDCVAFSNPLDSSNVGPTEWIAIARLLQKYMDKYEGFVVLHGTDTMVYSASALSFMLVNLRKPVIFTGSQLSAIGHVRNDAIQNLLTAASIANPSYSRIANVPEVCIFFHDKLLRGNRTIKVDSEGYDAYESPNFPPLGTTGAGISINRELLLSESGSQAFSIYDHLSASVIDLTVFPGIQNSEMLRQLLSLDGLKAVVLRSFGTGNVPTDPKFLSQLEIATRMGVIVVNVTQCARGSVQMGLYETSAALMKYGVINGFDITPQAALTKLMVLLGDDLVQDAARSVQVNLRGEQSQSVFVTTLEQDGGVVLTPDECTCWLSTERDVFYDESNVSNAVLLLHSARIEPGVDRGSVTINVYVNVPRGDDLSKQEAKLVCSSERLRMAGDTLAFDVTSGVRHLLVWRRNSLTVQLADDEGSVAWQASELAIYSET